MLTLVGDNPTWSGVKACCVHGLLSDHNAKKLLNILISQPINCFNTVECYKNFMITIYSSLDISDSTNSIAADIFMKLRHDYFAFLFLKQVLGEEILNTDVTFKDALGLDSNRTPDYIHLTDLTVKIFEFAVTQSSDFADSKKGTPSDSKYQEEITILKSEGYEVNYYPIILRLDKTYEDNTIEWEGLGFHVNLNDLHSIFKLLSDQFYRNFAGLFLKQEKHFRSQSAISEWQSYPFKRQKYFRCNIRDPYEVLKTHRNRLFEILRGYERENEKIAFVYNIEIGTLTAFKTDEGMYVNCLNDWLASGINDDKILKYIRMKQRATSFETAEFNIVDKIYQENTFDKEIYNLHNNSVMITDDTFTNCLLNLEFEEREYRYEPVPMENMFTKGVPSPFDFNEVLEKAITLIEDSKPSEEMLSSYMNDDNARENIYNQCVEHTRAINIAQGDCYHYPKTSFTMFIKPPGEVKTTRNLLKIDDIKPFYNKVTHETYSILRLLPQFRTYEPVVAASFKELNPLRGELYKLVNDFNQAKSEWTKTEGCQLVHRRLIRFKDDKSQEAEKVRITEKALRRFQQQNSTVLRTFNKERFYNRLPIPKSVSQSIKKELFRYHNLKGTYGTGGYKNPDMKWGDNDIWNVFRNLTNNLLSITDLSCSFKVTFDNYSKTDNFTSKLKEKGLEEINNFEKYMSHTALGSTLEFNSILFKSVLYLSSCPFKSKFITLDNSGLKDTILLVKGGKSRSNSTKAFKVITTILPSAVHFYDCFSDSRTSWHIFDLNGKTYVETPWLRYQMGLCEHAHMAKYKFSMFYLTMHEEAGFKEIKVEKFILPILALLNGRRKLEVLLGNYRQLIMNFRAEYANILKLYKQAVEYSRDYVYYFCTMYILKTLKHFKANRHELVDIITDDVELDVSTWTINMYASRIMPKAAVDYTGELRNDIIAFLTTFKDCGVNKDTKLHDFEIDFEDDAFRNDLNFNPKLSWLVGCYVSDYIKMAGSCNDVLKGFKKVFTKNMFTTANNRGCRTDPNKDKEIKGITLNDYLNIKSDSVLEKLRLQLKRTQDPKKIAKLEKEIQEEEDKLRDIQEDNIFGRKGFQAYLDTFPDLEQQVVIEALRAPGPVSAAAVLHKNNTTLYQYYKGVLKGQLPNVVASIHAKSQWLGPREIFALTVEAKIAQQLAEGCFRVLCKHIPNEMISIPSDKRTMWLHSTIHQRVKKGTYIMSLDYRRWGPHSNFLKYKYFIMGMIDILPPCFFTFFNKMVVKMESKHIIIRKDDLVAIYKHAIVKDVLEKVNIKFYRDYILIHEPHSFIMGIYNYLSSLFHAGSQLLFRHLLHLSVLKKHDPNVDFYAIAHSDDAQGMFNCGSLEVCKQIITSYEVFGKHLNHMQSNKKSQIDKNSSEVISILRIDKKIISMVAKFTASFTISPSYKGYVMEAKNLISKVIELVANGATFNQSYKVYRILVYYLSYVLYHFNNACYEYPVEVLGTPDDYPYHILLYGNMANFLLNYYYYNVDNLKVQTFCKTGEINLIEGLNYNSNTKNLMRNKFNNYMSTIKEELREFLMSDTLLMNNFQNDTLLKLQIIARMKDPNFSAAMAGGHAYTGLSYLIKNNSKFAYALLDDVLVPWAARRDLFEKIKNIEIDYDLKKLKSLDFLSKDLKMFDYLPNRLEFSSNKVSLKPCQFVVETSLIRSLKSINYRKLHCYLYERHYLNIMDFTNTEMNQLKLFDSISTGLNIEQRDILAQSVCHEGVKKFYFYATVPTDKRTIESKSDLSNLIAYNTFRSNTISNINERSIPEMFTDNANRVYLEAASVIKEMCSVLYPSLRYRFLREYKMRFEGDVLRLSEVVYRCSNDFSPYKQVLGYQLSDLLRIQRYSWSHLPLFKFLKRQYGSGATWFGEGKILFMTRQTKITCILTNCSVRMMYVNKGSENEDLQYFVNELVHIGVRHPYYVKEISPKTEKLCIGFNSIFEMVGKITTCNNCDFIYPNVTFTDEPIIYPILMPRDIRKVVEARGNNIYYIRLSKDYSYTTILNEIDLKENKEWFEQNLKVSLPWFRKEDASFELISKPSIKNVIDLGFGYVFTSSRKPSSLAGSVFGLRKYMPGISGGITECIMENRPDYLRVPYESKMWVDLTKRYPGSFIKNIYKERVAERTQAHNLYLKKLHAGSIDLERAANTYISEVLELQIFRDLEKAANILTILTQYRREYVGYLVTTLLDLLEMCEIFNRFRYEFIDVYMNVAVKNEWKHMILFFNDMYRYVDNLTREDYCELQRKVGRPWSLIPFDKKLIMFFIIQLVKHYNESYSHVLDEAERDLALTNKTREFKYRIKMRIFDKLDHRLLTLEKLRECYSFKSLHRFEVKVNLGQSEGVCNWHMTGRLDYHGDINYFSGDEYNFNFYRDDDDFYDDLMEEETNRGFRRDAVYLRRGGKEVICDTSIIGRLTEPLDYREGTVAVYDCRTPSMVIYSKDYLYYKNRFPYMKIVYHPRCALFAMSLSKRVYVTETTGVIIRPENYENYVGLYNSWMCSDGSFMMLGKQYVHNPTAITDEVEKLIREIISPKDDIGVIEVLGRRVEFKMSAMNSIMNFYKNKESLMEFEDPTKVYEPLGTFVNDVALETLLKNVFPKTYLHLLRGDIKLHYDLLNSFKLINRSLGSTEQSIMARILRSVSIIPNHEHIDKGDKEVSYDFIRELNNFILGEEDETQEEDVELLIDESPSCSSQTISDVPEAKVVLKIRGQKTKPPNF
nr:MAG: RNA-dependent RNA polymerase [Wufeng shrew bunyavirus 4]